MENNKPGSDKGERCPCYSTAQQQGAKEEREGYECQSEGISAGRRGRERKDFCGYEAYHERKKEDTEVHGMRSE